MIDDTNLHHQREIARLDGEVAKLRAELQQQLAQNTRLHTELQRQLTRLDEAFVLGWTKGVTESIDKLYAYRASVGEFDADKAIELLNFHVQHPPTREAAPPPPHITTVADERVKDDEPRYVVRCICGWTSAHAVTIDGAIEIGRAHIARAVETKP